MTHMSPESVTDETLHSDDAHAFCPSCVPWTTPMAFVLALIGIPEPAYIEGLCGALVLSSTVPSTDSLEEQQTAPPNACRQCVEAVVCPKCGKSVAG